MNGTCSCGFVGLNCSETGYVDGDGQVVLQDLVSTPEQNCTDFEACIVENEKAFCGCLEELGGDLCSGDQVIVWVMALAFVLPLIVAGICVAMIWRRGKHKDFGFHAEALTQGVAGPRVVLAFRAIVLVYVTVVLLFVWVTSGLNDNVRQMYRYYTIVSYTLLWVFFVLGVVLSARACSSSGAARSDYRLSWLERAFFVMGSVNLPTSVFIFIIVWSLLFPQAADIGNAAYLLDFGSISMHVTNVVVVFADFGLTGWPLLRFHAVFVVLWACVYVLWISTVMATEYALGLRHKPPYPFLSWESPFYPAYTVGMLVGLVLLHLLLSLLTNLKAPVRDAGDAGDVEKASSCAETAGTSHEGASMAQT